MLIISHRVVIPENELEYSAIRAQGPGGQNVNKVSSAVHLRFDLKASSLPEFYKQKLLSLKDQRINKDGVIVIKAQQSRSQEKNRELARERLRQLIKSVIVVQKKRIPTRASSASKKRRMDSKTRQGRKKELRRKLTTDNF